MYYIGSFCFVLYVDEDIKDLQTENEFQFQIIIKSTFLSSKNTQLVIEKSQIV